LGEAREVYGIPVSEDAWRRAERVFGALEGREGPVDGLRPLAEKLALEACDGDRECSWVVETAVLTYVWRSRVEPHIAERLKREYLGRAALNIEYRWRSRELERLLLLAELGV